MEINLTPLEKNVTVMHGLVTVMPYIAWEHCTEFCASQRVLC